MKGTESRVVGPPCQAPDRPNGPALAAAVVFVVVLGPKIYRNFKEFSTEENVAIVAVDVLVSLEGLEEALAETYSDFEVPVEIFEGLTLTKVRTRGPTVIFKYRIDPVLQEDGTTDVYEVVREIDVSEICVDRYFRNWMTKGAGFVNQYVTPDGAEVERIVVRSADCEGIEPVVPG